MRNWIDMVDGKLLSEEQLDERSMTKVEIKGKEVMVMTNPRRSTLLRMVNDQNRGWFRGFLTDSGDVEVFDAFLATHYDIGSALGISGRRFELRGGKGTDYVTMLYITQADYVTKDEWRSYEKITRMLPEDFHIGSLRW